MRIVEIVNLQTKKKKFITFMERYSRLIRQQNREIPHLAVNHKLQENTDQFFFFISKQNECFEIVLQLFYIIISRH